MERVWGVRTTVMPGALILHGPLLASTEHSRQGIRNLEPGMADEIRMRGPLLLFPEWQRCHVALLAR